MAYYNGNRLPSNVNVTVTQDIADGSVTRVKLATDVTNELDHKMNDNGYYQNAGVGMADNLASPDGIDYSAEFFSETTGGSTSITDCPAEIKKIKGKTYVKNQYVDTAYYGPETSSNNVTITSNTTTGVITVVVGTGGATDRVRYRCMGGFSVTQGHKILMKGAPSNAARYVIQLEDSYNNGKDYGEGTIYTESTTGYAECYLNVYSGCPAGTYIFKPNMIDLTMMYGAGNEPTSVAEFETLWGYIPHTHPTLISSKPTSMNANGKNQFSGSTWALGRKIDTTDGTTIFASADYNSCSDFVRVISGNVYKYVQDVVYTTATILYYDSAKSYLSCSDLVGSAFTPPANCEYIRINIYKSGGSALPTKCFMWLPWTDWTNLTIDDYAPYSEHTQAIDTTAFPDGLKSARSVYDYKDYGIRKNVNAIGKVKMKDLTWTRSSSGMPSGAYCFFSNVITLASGNIHNEVNAKYQEITSNYVSGLTVDKTCLFGSNKIIYVRDDTYTDVTAFANSLTDDDYIYYELAAPVITDIPTTENNTLEVCDHGIEWVENATGYELPVNIDLFYMENLSDNLRVTYHKFNSLMTALDGYNGDPITDISWTNNNDTCTITKGPARTQVLDGYTESTVTIPANAISIELDCIIEPDVTCTVMGVSAFASGWTRKSIKATKCGTGSDWLIIEETVVGTTFGTQVRRLASSSLANMLEVTAFSGQGMGASYTAVVQVEGV